MPFTVGQHVVHNASAENTTPAAERLYDIGKIIELDDTHALIYFPVSGHVDRIIFDKIADVPKGVSPPYQTIPLEVALNYYNMRNGMTSTANNTANAENTVNAMSPLNAANIPNMPNMPRNVSPISAATDSTENFIHKFKPTKSLSINNAEELDDSNSEAD
jgi:hypothetical protein